MAEIAVGIDLGTSNTCVSMMQDGEVQVLANAFGERTSASVVHFHDDGSVEVGNSAKAKVIRNSSNRNIFWISPKSVNPIRLSVRPKSVPTNASMR